MEASHATTHSPHAAKSDYIVNPDPLQLITAPSGQAVLLLGTVVHNNTSGGWVIRTDRADYLLDAASRMTYTGGSLPTIAGEPMAPDDKVVVIARVLDGGKLCLFPPDMRALQSPSPSRKAAFRCDQATKYPSQLRNSRLPWMKAVRRMLERSVLPFGIGE